MGEKLPTEPHRDRHVFISYSSEDRETISPLVQLVRAARRGSVFQDYTSILPGERWHERVLEAIAEAQTMMVFWCEHSAASEHVREEYELGIESVSEVVPLLLDDTALPEALSAFEWIDFRRPEQHGGLARFIPIAYKRSRRHFYPTDELGEYRDWDREDYDRREMERRKAWDEAHKPRMLEMAEVIAARVPK